ncbi:NUDIX domain-containing protein [Streptomyces sp. NPDC055681]
MPVLGDAATVVLLRDSIGGPKVLLRRRPAHGTYPGVWVFPGGAVEPGDRGPGGRGSRSGLPDPALRGPARHGPGPRSRHGVGRRRRRRPARSGHHRSP